MTIFITGGTGKTGLKLAQRLHAANHPILIASRSGKAPEPFADRAVTFDWFDQTTFENPFKADPNVDRVYLISPSAFDPLPVVKPFIDLAIKNGVKRFVLLSAAGIEKGGFPYGKIHEYLVDIGIEYAILRPTWFAENFGALFIQSIRNDNEFSTVSKDGLVPFVGVDDIAKVTFDSLVSEKAPNTDYFIIGPKLHSYDEAAAILSDIVGRKITHKRISNEEERKIFEGFGMSPEYAKMLNGLDASIANGTEEALVGNKKTITGKLELRNYFEANKHLWVV